jgi:hypothetical protein
MTSSSGAVMHAWRAHTRTAEVTQNAEPLAGLAAGDLEVEIVWCPGPETNRNGVATEGF